MAKIKLLLSAFVIIPSFLFAQKKETQKIIDSIKTDSTLIEKKLLKTKISYKSKDYVLLNKTTNTITLYNEGEVTYDDLKLTSGTISLNYKTKETTAGRIAQKEGDALEQPPNFIQGNSDIKPDSLRFNYDTKRAYIWNAITEQNDGTHMISQNIKRSNDSVYYIKEGKLTTSKNLKNPEYYFRIRKAKLIPNKRVVTKSTNMYIEDFPTVIWLPFAYFPLKSGRSSGIIFPIYGSSGRGLSLQNGGYYFPISDYVDLTLLGDVYSNSSYGLKIKTDYKLRYRFSGNFNYSFENNVTSQRGFSDFSKSVIWNLRWSHRKDTKANPNFNFNASVNIGSSEYYRESQNQVNTSNFLNNNLASSISYSRIFPKYPSINFSINANHSQNLVTKSISMTLPSINANMERVFPFAPKIGSKKGAFQNINFQYSGSGQNSIQTTDSLFLSKQMFDEAKIDIRHSLPLTTNFRVLKYFNINAGFSYEDIWLFKTINQSSFNPVSNTSKRDTISGFARFNTYNYNAGIGTTVYGTFPFGEDKKIQAIRHVMQPNISYTITPGFEEYYNTYISDAQGGTAEYSPYSFSQYSVPGKEENSSISFSLNNQIEAKITEKDTTIIEPRKVAILNSFNLSTGYSISADSLNWSPLRINGGMQLFKNKLNINFGGSFDPYAINNNGQRIELANSDNNGSFFRFTDGNINASFTFNNDLFKSKNLNDNNQNTGGRTDGLFGNTSGFNESYINNNFTNTDDEDDDDSKISYYKFSIPWSLNIASTLQYSNRNREKDLTSNSIMLNGSVQLSKRWDFGVSSGYDFINHGFTHTQIRINRDLKSWAMNFNWTPLSVNPTWYFFIGIKANAFNAVKYEERGQPDIPTY